MSIKHLVFSGGAIKGLSYIGCYKALEELKLLDELETCAGCSIGAIFATLIVLGYTGEELYDFILHFSYQDIRDLNFLKAFSHYGLETGEKITRFLGAIIKRKTGNPQITFLELFQKTPIKLVINATNLNTYKIKYFDHISSPDMPVLLALRMSISVPFLIKPVVYQKQFYVDGGLLDNLPVSQVPDSLESLAFDLEPVADLDISYNIQSLESYSYHVFGCIYTEINQYRMSKVKNIRIIKLDTQKVHSFSLNLTQEQRIFLFTIGYETVLKTFSSDISLTDAISDISLTDATGAIDAIDEINEINAINAINANDVIGLTGVTGPEITFEASEAPGDQPCGLRKANCEAVASEASEAPGDQPFGLRKANCEAVDTEETEETEATETEDDFAIQTNTAWVEQE